MTEKEKVAEQEAKTSSKIKKAKKEKRVDSSPQDHVASPIKLKTPKLEGEWGSDRFLERELSWLDFNERVLELAEDQSLFLLERANFLSIFASNLDEFFMVRVAGLERRIATGIAVPSASGEAPEVLLDNIRKRAYELQKRHVAVYTDDIQPKLKQEGIQICNWDDLDTEAQVYLTDYFTRRLFPILTPLAVDPAHPFPYISGLSLNLAILLENPKSKSTRFARLKIPTEIKRFIAVDQVVQPTANQPQRFVPMEQIIQHHLDVLFPGMNVVENHLFRVTRNEDVSVEEDEADNLLKALEKELLRRKFGAPVRLEVLENISDRVLHYLLEELEIDTAEVYKLSSLDLRCMSEIAGINRPDLHYPPHAPNTNRWLRETESNEEGDVFGAINEHAVLLHHPYDAFQTSVQAFIEQASTDPNVRAIKQTLYRTSGDSPIIQSLINAAQSGKQVLAIVEIKARFDEEANISWARKLEKAGVHVVYGIVGLKTHCKLSLAVRKEKDGSLKRYAHIGTGNYHPKTARFYEDLGVLTCDPVITEDVAKLFNQLSGYAPKTNYRRLLVAPGTLRSGLVNLMENEIENAKAGKKARIQIKVNSMVDEIIIDELYRASQAGVEVEIVVRGICGLRPGVPGLSENIQVRSILGRYLEHSRIFGFHNDGDEIFYIGSSDMMHRNLDRRVETLVKITDHGHREYLSSLFTLYMSKKTSSWSLQEQGTWIRHSQNENGKPLVDAQTYLVNRPNLTRRERIR
ncbi:MAG: RNA degradosome polyphosphate kinase [Micrococcaceae bacterium]